MNPLQSSPDERQSMVGWFDPRQLTRTGVGILISSLFARYMDRRQIQALATGPGVYYEFDGTGMQVRSLRPTAARLSAAEGAAAPAETGPITLEEMGKPHARLAAARSAAADADFWFDYVADVGDGWDSTYAVATALARPLTAGGQETKAGSILVFGGDEVYPLASAPEYESRLVAAYRAAFATNRPDDYPVVFALPGNHDWYDNLVSFSRLFCSNEPFAGPAGDPVRGCYTPQRRGYFALKLPRGWWLLGVDLQLSSDIDGAQYDFFQRVSGEIGADERIILCVPEPHWVYAEVMPRDRAAAGRNALAVLEKLLGDRVRVFVAGDVHHYCHYETTQEAPETRSHKITAGGGGAFLHPTHGVLDVAKLEGDKYRKTKCYPSTGRSRLMALGNLLFGWKNIWFGVMPAVAYVFLLWVLMPVLEEFPTDDPNGLYDHGYFRAVAALFADPGRLSGHISFLHMRLVAASFLPILMFGFYLFTDLKTRWGSVVAGGLHGAAHYFSALFFAWLASVVWFRWQLDGTGFDPETEGFWTPGAFWFATAFVFVAGWVAGSTLMGAYLCVVSLMGSHWNAAFSALRCDGWKNFLRFKIDARGRLTIFPLGIREVPRTRRRGPDATTAVAVDAIEAPIVVGK